MNNWKSWEKGNGRPIKSIGLIDIQYADGKEFYRKRVQDCYWGADSLIRFWRVAE